MKTMTDAFTDYGNEEEFFSEECFDEGEHTAVSKATVNYGLNDRTTVTELCIRCNVRLRSWDEYPDDFTF